MFFVSSFVPFVAFVSTGRGLVAARQWLPLIGRAGYNQPFTALEDGIGDYVRSYLSLPDHYR